MARRDMYPCPHCQGSGQIELTGIYADTLAALRKVDREINGAELASIVGAKPTAVCNRLVALERHGFAFSRRYGAQRLWKAT